MNKYTVTQEYKASSTPTRRKSKNKVIKKSKNSGSKLKS